MTNKTVKKWAMNDFLIALEKVLEEHDSCLQVDPQGYIVAVSGIYTRLDKAIDKTNIGNFINDSLRPENQFKETKMDKQKYKSVPVTDVTIWQLGQAVSEGGEFYDDEGCILFIHTCNCTIQSSESEQAHIAMQLKRGEITTRQPLPWYEVEGVFPCLVKCFGYKFPIMVTEFKSDFGILIAYNSLRFHAADCTPLTPSEAAEYGVE